MRQFITLGFLIVLVSCHNDKDKRTIQTNLEMNKIVDELVRFRFHDVALVQIETVHIYQDVKGDSIDFPPPSDFIIFPKEFFEIMAKRKLIDEIDAEYMYTQIDTSVSYCIDSLEISKPTISYNDLKSLFNGKDIDSVYDFLWKKHGSSCFLNISTPIFNQSFTKAVISVDYHCGPLNGQGYNIIFEKVSGKWRIIFETKTWVS